MANRVNLKTVYGAVLKRESFECNTTLIGHSKRFGYGSTRIGWLPSKFMGEFHDAKEASDFYVVVSYATPIAWYANGKWRVPDVKYSPTTSRHLQAIRIKDGQVTAGWDGK